MTSPIGIKEDILSSRQLICRLGFKKVSQLMILNLKVIIIEVLGKIKGEDETAEEKLVRE